MRRMARGGPLAALLANGSRGCTSLIEVIGSDFIPQSKVQYLLPRFWRATLVCNFTKFLCQLAVMLAINRRDGRFRFSHG